MRERNINDGTRHEFDPSARAHSFKLDEGGHGGCAIYESAATMMSSSYDVIAIHASVAFDHVDIVFRFLDFLLNAALKLDDINNR